MTSAKSKRFSPFSLDAVNFLSADVRGAVGPYLNVFLVTRQHWSQSEVGLVTTLSGLLDAPLRHCPDPSLPRDSHGCLH